MSALVLAVLDFAEALHRETGEEPRRLVLPARAYDMLQHELGELCREPLVDTPISGKGQDGRLWLAAMELVCDEDPSSSASPAKK